MMYMMIKFSTIIYIAICKVPAAYVGKEPDQDGACQKNAGNVNPYPTQCAHGLTPGNISYLGKRKFIFKHALGGDMLVPRTSFNIIEQVTGYL